MEKEKYRNIEEVILSNEETAKLTLKLHKFEKLNYLKYKPANENTLQPNETVDQHGSSKLSYTNALKQNNYKAPTNNATNRTSERPTSQLQLKSFSAKHIRRNRSGSRSRQQSTTKTNDQSWD